MKQSYTAILNLKVEHAYFSSGLFDAANFSWDKDTSRLLKNLGLICKPTLGGISLLARDRSLLDSIQEDIPIRFELNSKDEFFFNYTDLPRYELSEDLLYFSNKSVKTTAEDQTNKLHPGSNVAESEVFRLTRGSLSFMLTKDGPSPKFYDLSKIPLSADIIVEKLDYAAIKEDLPKEYNKEYIIKNLDQGPFLLILEEDTNQYKYYNNTKSLWKKPLSIIEIYPTNLAHHLAENSPVQYNISFANKKTKWVYFLMDPGFQRFDNLSVVNKKDKKEICKPYSNRTANVQGAKRVLVSEETIPLKQKSDEIYQLVDNHLKNGNERKVVINNLPRASPEQLHREPEESDLFEYSHIYI